MNIARDHAYPAETRTRSGEADATSSCIDKLIRPTSSWHKVGVAFTALQSHTRVAVATFHPCLPRLQFRAQF